MVWVRWVSLYPANPYCKGSCRIPWGEIVQNASTWLYAQETGRIRVSSRLPLTEKRYWRLRRLESAVPAQLALKNVTLRKGRDTLCKVRQSGTCCAEREQPICTASRWQLMESLSGTAVSSTVAIVGSIWPKGPAQAGPVIQAQ